MNDMKIQSTLLEAVTSPSVSLPVVGTAGIVNVVLESLPIVINIGSAIYILLLISHKAYQMLQEYKEKKNELKE